jgi:hypothetical protein
MLCTGRYVLVDHIPMGQLTMVLFIMGLCVGMYVGDVLNIVTMHQDQNRAIMKSMNIRKAMLFDTSHMDLVGYKKMRNIRKSVEKSNAMSALERYYIDNQTFV